MRREGNGAGGEEEESEDRGEKRGLWASPALGVWVSRGFSGALLLTLHMQQARMHFAGTLSSNNTLTSLSTSFPKTSEGVTKSS